MMAGALVGGGAEGKGERSGTWADACVMAVQKTTTPQKIRFMGNPFPSGIPGQRDRSQLRPCPDRF
jgi:hypothetical protein